MPKQGTGYLDVLSEPPDRLPGWLTEADIDHYAGEFARTGFTGGLNWYRNMDRNWTFAEHLADALVTVPALFVAGERDPVLRMTPPAVMDGWLTDLRGSVILSGAGHWIQQERPSDVNDALLGFLRGLDQEDRQPTD
jgi:pimeloyl-ACP methyl ester carboxylesterase